MADQPAHTLDHIFQNNKKWVETKSKADPAFFNNLAAGQKPNYL